VKSTRYVQEQVLRKHPYLKAEWRESDLRDRIRIEHEDDGRGRHWAPVAGRSRHLRVVTLDDGETVHNAFPDRRYLEDQR
jgi:hypothetical protein